MRVKAPTFSRTINANLFRSRHQRAKLALLAFLAAIGRHSIELGQVQPYREYCESSALWEPFRPINYLVRRVEDSTRIDVVRVRPGQPKRRTRWNERTRRRRPSSQLVSVTMPSVSFSTPPLFSPLLESVTSLACPHWYTIQF